MLGGGLRKEEREVLARVCHADIDVEDYAIVLEASEVEEET